MQLNRRNFLRLGAAGAGGMMLSSAACSAGLSPLVFRDVPAPGASPALATTPAAPAAAAVTPAGIKPELFARAKAALDAHKLPFRDTIGIVDFSKGSNEKRFHIVDLASGKVDSFHVTHGRGSDPAHSGFLEQFSNEFGSKASSNGTYTTSDTYHGKYGLSMKVQGRDLTNCNAESRAIVIHNAWYAEPDVLAATGKLGRSEGCFAFSRKDQWDVMKRLGGGRMIYADKLA